MLPYKHYSLSKIGNGHILRKLPCQDSSNSLEKDGVYFAIVSDGCGSVDKCDIGAQTLTEKLPEYICSNFDSIYEKDEEEAKQEINTFVRKAIVERAMQDELNPNEMLCTYLFVAVKENKYIICQLGDGCIIATFKDGGYVVFEEEKKEEAEKTHYFNNNHFLKYMNYGVGDDTLVGAFLFTDGINNDAAISEEEARTIIENYIDFACDHKPEEIMEKVDGLLDKRLKETSDDCSIAIIALDNTSKEAKAVISKKGKTLTRRLKMVKMSRKKIKKRK